MAFKFSDVVVARFKDLGILSAEIKCYIADDNNKWVDFTDKEEVKGTNRLVNLGAVTHATESQEAIGAFHTTTQDIIMENADNFWDSPLFDLTTVDGVTAVFGSTVSAQMSVFYRHRLKIAVMIQMKEGTPVETPVGIFLIEDIQFNNNKTISIKTVGLAKPLMEHSAEPVKDGISPFTNRPIKFLVEELLKQEYGEIRGASGNNRWRIPQSFNLPDDITLPTADGERTSSSFGRAPEWDGTEWRNDGLTCRALLWSFGLFGHLKGWDGPSAPAESLKDTLYLGCDDELWSYNPTTDTYIVHDDSTLGTAYKIRRLWYNPTETTSPSSSSPTIWGVATTDQSDSSRTVTMKIFWWDNPSVSDDITVITPTTISDIFIGDFIVRKGVFDSGSPDLSYVGVHDIDPPVDSQIAGWNTTLPFSQHLTSLNDTAHNYNYTKVDGPQAELYDGGAGEVKSAIGNIGVNVKSGYYKVATPGAGVVTDLKIRYSLGQIGCLLFNENAGTSGVILWFEYDSSTDRFISHTYDISGDTVTTRISITFTDGEGTGSAAPLMPTSGCVHPSDDKFYFGMVGFDEKPNIAGGNPYDDVMSVVSYDYSSPASSTFLVNPGESTWYGYKSLEMIYVPDMAADGDSNIRNIVMVLLYPLWDDHSVSPKDSKYQIYKIRNTTTQAYDSSYIIVNRPWHPKGLVLGTTEDSGGTSGDIYFTNVGPGSLSKLVVDDGTVEVLDFGWPVVDGETNLSSNLVIDAQTRSGASSNIIYGNSAPYYPVETQDTNDPPVGKYYLWKFDSFYSGRIELADFEGMKIWDALQDLAQISSHVMGFTSEGDFFFVPRGIADAADFTLKTDDPTDNVVESMTKNLGYKEIYNYCSITPSKAVVQEPKSEFIIKKRADGTPLDSRYIVDQRDSLKKNIRMSCIQEGTITDKDAHFEWLTYNTPTEALITQVYTQGDTTIYLSSVFGGDTEENGVHADDYIQVIDPSNNREVTARIKIVSTVDNSITISSSDANSFPSVQPETACLILRQNKLDSATTTVDSNRNKWSDEGVTFVTKGFNNKFQQVNSLGNISLQTVVRFGTIGTFARVASINTSSKLIYLKSATASVAQSPNLTINVTTNAIVYALYSPIFNGTNGDTNADEIGNTNVFVRWETKSGGDNTFKRGDAFYIECPGLKLEKEEESKQVFINSTSVLKYKRKEFPGVNNKFFDRKMARDFARKIVNDYYNPKYILNVKSILLPYINFVNDSGVNLRVDVQDKFNFRNRRSNIEKCLVRSIKHDLTNFKSIFVLKGKDFY